MSDEKNISISQPTSICKYCGMDRPSNDELSSLLLRRSLLVRIMKKTDPRLEITYKSLLRQLVEVEGKIQLGRLHRTSDFTVWFETVFIPIYLRAFRWLVLGLSCVMGAGYIYATFWRT